MFRDDNLIRVGIIIRPHGRGGEVIVKPLTDFPSRFHQLSSVTLIPSDGNNIFQARISRVREHGKHFIVKLQEVDSRTSALEILNHEIAVDEKDRIQLPPGSFYGYELVGLLVKNASGDRVGEVTDILSLPAQDLLVVSSGTGRESLVPLVEEIVAVVSVSDGYIIISELPGLIESED